MQRKMIAFVLAGGMGSRLLPLTRDRAKPAISFGGKYRIIDFVLSNLINSGVHSIYVLVQFNSQSLLRHLRHGWQFANILNDQFIIPVPAQKRSSDGTWYEGTADAVYQNLNLIDEADDQVIGIFGADHVYRMDIHQMLQFHEQKGAEVTVAAIPMRADLASEFGVVETDADGAILGFHEKQADAPRMPGEPNRVYASMGNYLFSARTLLRALRTDSEEREISTRDFGRDILPSLLARTRVYAYDFQTNHIPGEASGGAVYWRDVGTLEAYYEAQMDLCGSVPALNLYNLRWPIRTASYADPSAKFTYDNEGQAGQAVGSLVSGGCVLAGATVRNSVLGRNVRVGGALIEDSILLDNCVVGPKARIRRAILDEDVTVPEGETIGYDLNRDQRYHHVTETGIVVVENLACNRGSGR